MDDQKKTDCDEKMQDLKKMTLKEKIIASAIVVFCFFIVKGCISDINRNSELESSDDPARIAYLLIDYTAEDANSKVKHNKKEIEVEFSIDPWLLTPSSAKTSFLSKTKKLMEVYFLRFHDIESIKVVATGSFTDMRGNQYSETAMEILFTRNNANSINWENVSADSLPSLSNDFWIHPAFNRE